jgi:hypothetical protein
MRQEVVLLVVLLVHRHEQDNGYGTLGSVKFGAFIGYLRN